MALEMPGLIPYILVIILIKYLKQRLNDQFIQKWKSNVLPSIRFTVLSTLFNRYEMSTYITAVKNPDIRNIYIYTAANWYECVICVPHLQKYDIFCDNVSSHSPDLKDKNEMTKLKYILDLQCLPDTVRYCCQYIWDNYCFRGKCDK